MKMLRSKPYELNRIGGAGAPAGVVWLGLLLLISVRVSLAQSCSGTLGEPIVNETFGSGQAGPLPPGRTTFLYRNEICLSDGEYTLSDTVWGGCHGDAWHTVREDHTPGDQRGNMLVVNASYQPAEFYSQTIRGLCVGTTYEFSLWVLNLNLPQPPGACGLDAPRNPDIAMQIQTAGGGVIQTVSTGAVARTLSPVWVRFSMLFTMPEQQEDIVIKLINKGLGGCGNDLALDDIQFRVCHPDLSVRFASTPASSLTLCQYGTETLASLLGAGYVNPVYQWQESTDKVNWTPVPGATSPQYQLKADFRGTRHYRVRCIQAVSAAGIGSSYCSAVSNAITLTTLPAARVDLGPDTTLCRGRTLTLTVPNPDPSGSTYVWEDGSMDKIRMLSEDGVYWLETRFNDCSYRDSVVVSFPVCTPSMFYVPGGFTPNGDGINDQLAVYHGEYVSFELKIYDRWGNVIFVSQRPEERWDGNYLNQPCMEGKYAWIIEFNVMDRNGNPQTYRQRGSVLLIRR